MRGLKAAQPAGSQVLQEVQGFLDPAKVQALLVRNFAAEPCFITVAHPFAAWTLRLPCWEECQDRWWSACGLTLNRGPSLDSHWQTSIPACVRLTRPAVVVQVSAKTGYLMWQGHSLLLSHLLKPQSGHCNLLPSAAGGAAAGRAASEAGAGRGSREGTAAGR